MEWIDAEGPAPSCDQVLTIERSLGVKFPQSYLEILKLGDGISPDYQFIMKTIDGERVAIDVFSRLFCIGNSEIIEAKKTLSFVADHYGHSADGLIPIADNGDGWICLDYRDPNNVDPPIVSFVQTQLDIRGEDGLIYLAPSFTELLALLSDCPA